MIPLRFMGVSSLRRVAERRRSSGRPTGATQRWVNRTHSDGSSGETYPGSDVSEASGLDRLWTPDASLLCEATSNRLTVTGVFRTLALDNNKRDADREE